MTNKDEKNFEIENTVYCDLGLLNKENLKHEKSKKKEISYISISVKDSYISNCYLIMWHTPTDRFNHLSVFISICSCGVND